MGGKRDGVGAAVWNAVPLLGGMGLKVTPHQIYSSNMGKQTKHAWGIGSCWVVSAHIVVLGFCVMVLKNCLTSSLSYNN